MQEIQFRLAISKEQYLAYYQGVAKSIRVQSINGQVIQFPANLLTRFVTHTGIYGLFSIQYDQDNRCIGLNRIGN